jgi:hypothetical protein
MWLTYRQGRWLAAIQAAGSHRKSPPLPQASLEVHSAREDKSGQRIWTEHLGDPGKPLVVSSRDQVCGRPGPWDRGTAFAFIGVYVIAAAAISLLLAAATPARPWSAREVRETERDAAAAVATLGVFFWLLLGLSLLAIVLDFVLAR